MKNITKGYPDNKNGIYPFVDLTSGTVTMMHEKTFDGWILKTKNPGDDCFYVEGGVLGTRTNLTSDSITALFEAPSDSIFYKQGSTPNNVNIESIVKFQTGITSISNSCFFYSGITSIIIPDGVNLLDGFCFSHCSELISVVIPSSVNKLNMACFGDCVNLSSITFNGVIPPNCESSIFYNVPESLIIHVPSNYQGTTFGGRTVTKDLPEVV